MARAAILFLTVEKLKTMTPPIIVKYENIEIMAVLLPKMVAFKILQK